MLSMEDVGDDDYGKEGGTEANLCFKHCEGSRELAGRGMQGKA